MQNLIRESLNRNGNGAAAIVNARGISHRGWTPEQRVAAAADAVLGATHVVPSIGQAATAFNVSAPKIRAELKARAAAKEAAEHAGREATEIEEAYAVNRLIDAWFGASPKAREVAVREVGVANVWDVIARIVG
jgi:hypothetical protein